MRLPRPLALFRWLAFAAVIIALDVQFAQWVIANRSTKVFDARSITASYRNIYYGMLDGSRHHLVFDGMTFNIISLTMTHPPTKLGLWRVWWPAVAGGFLTLMAIAFARTRTGRWIISEIPLPRMTTRGSLIAVAILGTEGGLIVGTMRDSGIDPLRESWVPILVGLVILHAVAFMPAGIALLFRFLKNRRPKADRSTVIDRR